MQTLRHFGPHEDRRSFDFFTRLFSAAKRTDGGLAMEDFIRVSSIEECVEQIEKLGGRVVVPKKAVPGAGYFAVCLDAGNRAFGLWQDARRPAP